MAEDIEKTPPAPLPSASEEIARVLGFGEPEKAISQPQQEDNIDEAEVLAPRVNGESYPVIAAPLPQTTNNHSFGKTVVKRVIKFLPYVAVFSVSFLGYYYIFDPAGKTEDVAVVQDVSRTEKQLAMKGLQEANRVKYETWLQQFYFSIEDSAEGDMNRIGENGLTYFENFALNLNPKVKSVMGGDRADGYLILEGLNPRTGLQLSSNAQKIIDKYFDRDDILARLSGGRTGTTAQEFASTNTVSFENGQVSGATDTQVSSITGLTGIGTADYSANLGAPGRLEISKLGINVPIIWSEKVENIDSDLTRGIAHYPGTPLPGQVGTSYISGHSSNYVWVKADFNQVFAKINQVKKGDTFKVTVVDKNGQDVRLYYKVSEQIEFAANDQKQFENTAQSRIALSTCWPVGTTQKRLVTYAVLDRMER